MEPIAKTRSEVTEYLIGDIMTEDEARAQLVVAEQRVVEIKKELAVIRERECERERNVEETERQIRAAKEKMRRLKREIKIAENERTQLIFSALFKNTLRSDRWPRSETCHLHRRSEI